MAYERETNHPVVGRVRWRVERAVSRAPLTFLDGFVSEQVVTVRVPALVGVVDGRGGEPATRFDGHLKWYGRAVPQLLAAWAEVDSAGLGDRVRSFAGSFAPRLITTDGKPTLTPSNHAFATAFDINEDDNGYGVTPPLAPAPTRIRVIMCA